jgi:hypothetical protein
MKRLDHGADVPVLENEFHPRRFSGKQASTIARAKSSARITWFEASDKKN